MKKEDVYGAALMDFYMNTERSPLLLYTNNSPVSEIMPVDLFFRGEDEFPEQELIALSLCNGRVLDIGAGVGSHSLYLQKVGLDVTALELSTTACEIMEKRGVKQVINENIFDYQGEKYDTLLFLMNGIGLVENIKGLKRLFEHAKKLLMPGGQLLFDSSDINYYYPGEKDKPVNYYYGEITFQYEYKGQKGMPFGWLYIDQKELINIGNQAGWVVQILDEDHHYQYLARMELKTNS